MKGNKAIWVVLLLVAVAAAGAVTWFVLRDEQPAQEQPEQDEVETGVTTSDGFSTDAVIIMEDEMPEADPMIVGKWQSSDNPQWYKVYYDDYDEDEQLFWGKEWDESEDVLEEDLKYHGNGWFRWEKKGKELCEYSTLLKAMARLRQIRLSWLPRLIYRKWGEHMKANLYSTRPSLKVFQLYKLCYFAAFKAQKD